MGAGTTSVVIPAARVSAISVNQSIQKMTPEQSKRRGGTILRIADFMGFRRLFIGEFYLKISSGLSLNITCVVCTIQEMFSRLLFSQIFGSSQQSVRVG